jgi:hypothetical protein
MADNCVRTPGTGETVLADELTDGTLGSGKAQFVKLMDGTLDSSNKAIVDSSGNLQVETTNPSIAGTAGTPNSGVLSVQGITSMTPLQVGSAVANCIQWMNASQEYTTAQTSADIVALSGTTKFYIGRITIAAGYVASATTCTVKVYCGTGAYAAGTDQLVFGGEFSTIPGTGLVSYPGVVIGNGSAPFTISAAGDALKITTVASTHPRIYVSVDYIRV